MISIKYLNNVDLVKKETEKQLKKIQSKIDKLVNIKNKNNEAIYHCISVVLDYKFKILKYLNDKNLYCEDLKVIETVIYLTIDSRDLPVYEVKTTQQIKLRQYKGKNYSLINPEFKKNIRKFFRENNDFKQYIF
jgi:hypothetical protein